MQGKISYVPESDLNASDIRAGVADGTIAKWRRGVDGVQWYKKVDTTIYGTPAEYPAVMSGCEFVTAEDEDEDAELEAELDELRAEGVDRLAQRFEEIEQYDD